MLQFFKLHNQILLVKAALWKVWTATFYNFHMEHIDGLVQNCSNSSVLAMELLQSCTKPSIKSMTQ